MEVTLYLTWSWYLLLVPTTYLSLPTQFSCINNQHQQQEVYMCKWKLKMLTNFTNFKPVKCEVYINCTATDYIPGWSEQCVPESVKEVKDVSLVVFAIVEIIGIVLNTIVIAAFLYVLTCQRRIRQKFLRDEFTLTRKPLFVLFCHLSICDLLYCIFGLPTYW